MEKTGETRYQMLKRTHPKLYEYMMGGGQWRPYKVYTKSWMESPWKPSEVWAPSTKGLGFAKIFDWLNDIYGKNFVRYE